MLYFAKYYHYTEYIDNRNGKIVQMKLGYNLMVLLNITSMTRIITITWMIEIRKSLRDVLNFNKDFILLIHMMTRKAHKIVWESSFCIFCHKCGMKFTSILYFGEIIISCFSLYTINKKSSFN